MNYFLSNAAEGSAPPHAPLKTNKHLNIPFQSTQPRRGKDKSELQGLTPSSRDPCLRNEERGAGGRASILSVMPNAAPDSCCLGSPMDRGAWRATHSPWGHKDTTEAPEHPGTPICIHMADSLCFTAANNTALKIKQRYSKKIKIFFLKILPSCVQSLHPHQQHAGASVAF